MKYTQQQIKDLVEHHAKQQLGLSGLQLWDCRIISTDKAKVVFPWEGFEIIPKEVEPGLYIGYNAAHRVLVYRVD